MTDLRAGDPPRSGSSASCVGSASAAWASSISRRAATAGSRSRWCGPELGDDPQFRIRFRREVQASFRVQGRTTVTLVDFDTEGDQPWMAVEYIDGPPLSEFVPHCGPPARGGSSRWRWRSPTPCSRSTTTGSSTATSSRTTCCSRRRDRRSSTSVSPPRPTPCGSPPSARCSAPPAGSVRSRSRRGTPRRPATSSPGAAPWATPRAAACPTARARRTCCSTACSSPTRTSTSAGWRRRCARWSPQRPSGTRPRGRTPPSCSTRLLERAELPGPIDRETSVRDVLLPRLAGPGAGEAAGLPARVDVQGRGRRCSSRRVRSRRPCRGE